MNTSKKAAISLSYLAILICIIIILVYNSNLADALDKADIKNSKELLLKTNISAGAALTSWVLYLAFLLFMKNNHREDLGPPSGYTPSPL